GRGAERAAVLAGDRRLAPARGGAGRGHAEAHRPALSPADGPDARGLRPRVGSGRAVSEPAVARGGQDGAPPARHRPGGVARVAGGAQRGSRRDRRGAARAAARAGLPPVTATPFESPDVLQRLGVELAQRLPGRLALLGVAPAGLPWGHGAMLGLEVALLLSLVAMAMAALRRGLAAAPAGGPRRWLVEAVFAGLVVLVYRLARQLIRYPSTEIAPFLVRWDHLVFTVLAGT